MSAISGPGQQQSLTEAIAAAQSGAEPDVEPDGLSDDRVVESLDTCRECDSRPAGADGLCPPCRQIYFGDQQGGRRL